MAAFAKPEAKEMMRDGNKCHYFVSVFSTRMRQRRDQQDKY